MNFNFSSYDKPDPSTFNLKETMKTSDKISYYKTNQKDDYFKTLKYMYLESSTLRSLLDCLSDKIYGSGIVGLSEQDKQNIKDYKINSVFKKLCSDYAVYSACAIEVIFNVTFDKILKINWLPVQNIRSGQMEDDDKVNLYYYSTSWSAYKASFKDVTIFHTFEPQFNKSESNPRQIIYIKDNCYSDNFIYSLPTWASAKRWINIDILTSQYFETLVSNNFNVNTILTMPEFSDDESRIRFEKSIKENFTGSENAASIMTIYTNSTDVKPEITHFNQASDDEKYSWLREECARRISNACRLTNPILAGIQVPGILGGSSAEDLKIAEILYDINVVQPIRNNILEIFNQSMKYFDKPFNYEVNSQNIYENYSKTNQQENV